MLDRHTELLIALAGAVFATLLLFIWIPADTETAIIESFRRQTYLGDAFLPSLAAAGMLIAATGQLAVTLRRRDDRSEDRLFDHVTVSFFAFFAVIMSLSLAAMFWTGPLLWELLGDGERGYRQMRDTVPWKYMGFSLGGIVLVGGIIALLEGRLRGRTVLVAAGFVLVLILIFGVPFDTILLPPNGDW